MSFSKIDVLKLWFGENFWNESPTDRNNVYFIESNFNTWFHRVNKEFNRKILSYSNFSGYLEREHVAEKNSEDWAGPHGTFAKMLVFDQFNRTINSGTADAYKYDKYALECGKLIVENNWWGLFSVPERMFIVLPFEHSENLADHDTAEQLTTQLTEGYDCPELDDYLAKAPYNQQHREVLERFGRYPGRNQALVSH
jgi:uncharacterized protein (DUF924 family)